MNILAEKNINDHIDMIYYDIVTNFPELIKTDQEWSNLQDKNIFNLFKKRYNRYKFSDAFILFACINYNINKLKSILNSNSQKLHVF